jgi:hypothetical protein
LNPGKVEEDDIEEEEGITGNNAPVFGTETLGSDFGRAQPRYIKVLIST